MTSDTAGDSTPQWRIDDLAHRSGLSVDTIRFYQREGLLDPPTRRGRTAVYGPAHLHRLEQIRDLQCRHLSLAAIRGLLATQPRATRRSFSAACWSRGCCFMAFPSAAAYRPARRSLRASRPERPL